MARCSERTVHIQGAMHPYFLNWLENYRRLNARSSLRVSLHLLHFTCSVPEHPSSFWYSLLPQTGQNLQPMLNCACCILFSGLLLKERLFAKERLFDWIILFSKSNDVQWVAVNGDAFYDRRLVIRSKANVHFNVFLTVEPVVIMHWNTSFTFWTILW